MIRLVSFYLAFICILLLFGRVAAQMQDKASQKMIISNEETHMKSAKAFYEELEGNWTGSYSLWLQPGTPAQQSDIKANFQSAAKGNYFLMTYSWKKGEEAQEGVFLFGGNGNAATATWGDSFHMIPEPMQCTGELNEDGKKLIVKGSYSMGEGPDWGWRTEFTRHDQKSLLMEAYNIMSDGVEDLAVKAELIRVPKDKK
jgi:hypothetical protein